MRRLASAALCLLLCGACTPADSDDHSLAPSPASSASSPAPTDYAAAGIAEKALHELGDASGARDIIKIEVKRDNIVLVALKGKDAETWSFRGGKPTVVDGDTQYVHQSTFRLDNVDLSDIQGIFERARQVSHSNAPQELQVVEYYNGNVYMTVSTTPETQTVFFRPDATLVRQLDYAQPADLRDGIYEACVSQGPVVQVGLAPSVGAWCETQLGETQTIHTVRGARFPARSDIKPSKPAQETFDPSKIDASAILRVLNSLSDGGKHQVTVTIDRRDNLTQPLATFTAGGITRVTDLAGNDVTATVRR